MKSDYFFIKIFNRSFSIFSNFPFPKPYSWIKRLKQENAFLKAEVGNLNKQLCQEKDSSNYYYKKCNTLLELTKSSLRTLLEGLLEDVLIKENEKEVYNILKPLDPKGWGIYSACKELLKVDVYKEFIVEDTLGWFADADGYKLMHYAEIATFGNCTYRAIAHWTEVLDKYTIDKQSPEYLDYIKDLYPLAIGKVIGRLDQDSLKEGTMVIQQLFSCCLNKKHESLKEDEKIA